MTQFALKQWRQAGITNDFIFGNVMHLGNNCRDLLRAILPELHIQRVKLINTQKDIRDQYDQHGVRLDVFAEDEVERVYDVEMQVTRPKDLGERIRYYQSKIDMDSLVSGMSYGNIKRSYVIFLCPFDPFDKQLRRYTLQLRCDEEPALKLNTDAKVLLLNSAGKLGRVTPELSSFFALMNGLTVQGNSFGEQILKDIAAVKRDPVKERDFMDMALKMYDARQEGLKKGKTEGKLQMAVSVAQNLKRKGYNEEAIKDRLQDYFRDQLTEKEIKRIIKTADCKI